MSLSQDITRYITGLTISDKVTYKCTDMTEWKYLTKFKATVFLIYLKKILVKEILITYILELPFKMYCGT